ncbi:MAG: lysophospholipid acyltransferase family protein [Desulfosarcinaceae bacterium]|nr:lysophospholipid acyltransferase family protein [Desulfosarcinaceae bacterium]
MTLYDTPLVRPLMRGLALSFCWFGGWKILRHRPDVPKYVVIAAPHTSNWDFIYTLACALILRLRPCVMMKDAWFRWPLGYLFRWLGAIPIDRSKANGVVAQSIAAFKRKRELILVVPPAGTRQRVQYWKTGFYRIAHGAGVPIALAYLDYGRKTAGFGPMLQPSGDLTADMMAIQAFYRDITAKYPNRMQSWKASAPP